MADVTGVFLLLILLGWYWWLWEWSSGEDDPAEEICPVCGYYCLGKGGAGCIDKPGLQHQETVESLQLASKFSSMVLRPRDPKQPTPDQGGA